MHPFYITLGKILPLMIIPDSLAHVDGHPVLAYSYSIYHADKISAAAEFKRESELHLEKKDDPDYMGTIVFEIPGRSLSYIADGREQLSPYEVQELVDKINEYRETPALWPK